MHDEFDKKREVVALLMKMLGKNAHDEVSGSLAPKPMQKMADGGEVGSDHDDDVKGATDVTIVLPDGHGEMPMDDEMKDDMTAIPAMADGGMAKASDEPFRELVADVPEVNAGGNEDIDKEACSPMEMQDEDNNSSAFSAFMRKKKK